jgi:hypothetical protein
VKADAPDRASPRGAFGGCEVVSHFAGFVGARPADRVWRVNALPPRIAVEAAAAEGVRRSETSTRMIGNSLRDRLPAIVDGEMSAVGVRDVARGHVLTSQQGRPSGRYVLGGRDVRGVEPLERAAELSGVHEPLVVLPPEAGELARRRESVRLPGFVRAEGILLWAQKWRYSSRRARRQLGYRSRPLDRPLRGDTIDSYRDLIDGGKLGGGPPSPLSAAATGVRIARRLGLRRALRADEPYVGRRLLAGEPGPRAGDRGPGAGDRGPGASGRGPGPGERGPGASE